MITLTVRFVLSQFTFILSHESLSLGFFLSVELSAHYEFFFRVVNYIGWPHQRPQRPGRPPRGPPLFPPLGRAVRGCPCWPPLCWLLPRPPRCWPRGCVLPRWLADSWPDSQSGGGAGLGGGGGAGCAGLVAWGGVDLTGITDSSLARLLAGSAVSPPMT